MLAVHHRAAGRQIVEEAIDHTLLRPGLPMRDTATSDVGFGEEGETGIGKDDPATERRRRYANASQRRSLCDHLDVEVLGDEDLGEPASRGLLGSKGDDGHALRCEATEQQRQPA